MSPEATSDGANGGSTLNEVPTAATTCVDRRANGNERQVHTASLP
jgi:hypothetical protein